MSLQLVLGSSGSGKSAYIYGDIIKKSIENPDKEFIIVVPEQYTMQTQRNVVSLHKNHGVMNIDIVSFGRLAYRVFDEVGTKQQAVLEDTGKRMVIRKVLEQQKKRLDVFKGNVNRSGFISELKSTISELLQYNISPDMLLESGQALKGKPLLSGKLKDVAAIYDGFRNYIQEKYITAEEILDILYGEVDKSGVLKGCEVYLDEFTGFTPSQYKLLEKLLKICKKVVISLSVDPDEEPYHLGPPYKLFYLTKETIYKLEKLCMNAHICRDEDILLSSPGECRFKGSRDLAFLEKNIYRSKVLAYERAPEHIRLIQLKEPSNEADFAGGEILRLVREEGYRFRDIAIVAGSVENYEHTIEKVFKDMEIPFFIDSKKSILGNALVEFIRAALDMIYRDFSYESVFRYLRTGFTGICRETVDAMENYVLAVGIRGKSRWNMRWDKRVKGVATEDLLRLNEARAAFCEYVMPLYESLHGRDKTVRDFTVGLFEHMEQLKIQEKVEKWRQKFETENALALAREYAQIFKVVVELLEKMVDILGDEQLPLKEYIDILQSGFDEQKVGLIPPSMDQVVVGDIKRTRLDGVKVLFFMGVNDGLVPTVQKGGGIFTDADKETLEIFKMELAPTAKQNTYNEQFYLYACLTKASEKLYMTYAAMDMNKKPMTPSTLVRRLQKIFPRLETETGRDSSLGFSSKREVYARLIDGLRAYARGEEIRGFDSVFGWFKQDKSFAGKLDMLLDGTFYRHPEEVLSAGIVRALYGEVPLHSITTLEQYASCAFAHFLQYGLHLSERQRYELSAPDIGSIFHDAIDRFSKRMGQGAYDWFSIPDDVRDFMTESCVQEAASEYNHTIMLDNSRNEYLMQRMKRIAKRTTWALQRQILKGDFVPKDYEVSFTADMGLESMTISLPEQEVMKLQGKIDRLDCCEDENNVYVKVVDYKTGTKSFDLIALYSGLQLQLAVYLNAAMELESREHPGKKVVPAGILYYHIDDPIIDMDTGDLPVDEEILSRLKMDGLVNGSREVIGRMDKGLEGKSQVIPVALKKDGELSALSKVASEADFIVMSQYVKKKIGSLAGDIARGNIRIQPYARKNSSACDYCSYRSVCGFVQGLLGCDFKRIPELPDEEVWNLMRRDVDET